MEEIIRILSPALTSRMLTTEQREAFERGLSILENTPSARSFIRDSRRFHDYHRRVRQLLTYLQTLDTTDAQLSQKRRVGRPTKQEQAYYTQLQKQKALQEAKDNLFPELKPDVSLQPLTYDGIVADPNGESIAATMPNMKQIRVFLSAPLQEQVNNLRTLRNEAASKAEQAKTMTEANEKSVTQGKGTLYTETEIAELATRAVEIESHILPDIYTSIDREMGEVYLRLSQRTGDPEYIKYVEKTFNIAPQDLRRQFKPFYEKAQRRDPLFAQVIAEKIAADRPEVKAAREAVAQHKAEAEAFIKYICRKDKPSTKTRVKGLKDRIAKLREEYSDVVTEDKLKGFEAILMKTEEEAGLNN